MSTTLRDARRALLEAAFTDGHRHVQKGEELVFKVHSARAVRTKGGQLEVGGCLFPANRGLPPGEFVVQCAQGVPPFPGEARNGFGRVIFAPAVPVKWERLKGEVRVTSKAVEPDAITEEWAKTDDLRVDVGSVAFAEPGFGERLEQLAHEYGADDFDELMQLATAGLVDLAVVELRAPLLLALIWALLHHGAQVSNCEVLAHGPLGEDLDPLRLPQWQQHRLVGRRELPKRRARGKRFRDDRWHRALREERGRVAGAP